MYINVNEYREQCGCHSCERVFRLDQYDSGSIYYCTFGAEPRPKCGSVAMDGERFSHEDYYEEGGAYDKWIEWSKDKEVKPWAICEKFCKKILTVEELESIARDNWNFDADQYNQWDTLGQDEKDELIDSVKNVDRQN